MSLTLEQRKALDAAVVGDMTDTAGTDELIFLAGLRMGRTEMREEAARIGDRYAEGSGMWCCQSLAASIALDIRALPEEPT